MQYAGLDTLWQRKLDNTNEAAGWSVRPRALTYDRTQTQILVDLDCVCLGS